MKKISVVIPVFNAEKWIDRLLKSLKRQTVFEDLEIVFINDGSEDNSLSILKDFSKTHDNVMIINQKNGGVSVARNNGIKKSTSKYIAFIDADDYIDDDYFETYLNFINKDYDLIISGYIAEYSSGHTVKKQYETEVIDNNEEMMKLFLLGKIDPNCWNKLYKKEIISKIQFDKTMNYGEDKELLYNYLKSCRKISVVSDAKYHYIINEDSAMRKQYNRKSFKTLDKSEERIQKIKEEYPNLIEYAFSSNIDVKCRIMCSLVEFKLERKHKEIFKKIKKDIISYSIFKKKKYSTKKHFLAFLAIRISPRLYLFLKKNIKLQYK